MAFGDQPGGRFGEVEVGVFGDGSIDLQICGHEVSMNINDLLEIVYTSKAFVAWKELQKSLRNS